MKAAFDFCVYTKGLKVADDVAYIKIKEIQNGGFNMAIHFAKYDSIHLRFFLGGLQQQNGELIMADIKQNIFNIDSKL